MIREIIEKIIIWVLEHYEIKEIEANNFDRIIDITEDNIDEYKKLNGNIKVGWKINIPMMKKIRLKDYENQDFI